jgi:hypothetical protein
MPARRCVYDVCVCVLTSVCIHTRMDNTCMYAQIHTYNTYLHTCIICTHPYVHNIKTQAYIDTYIRTYTHAKHAQNKVELGRIPPAWLGKLASAKEATKYAREEVSICECVCICIYIYIRSNQIRP